MSDLIPYRRVDQWGYADRSRTIVVPCAFEQTFPFRGRPTAHVRRDGKSGLIDGGGRLVLPCDYDWIGNQDEGYLVEPDGTYGLERDGRFGFADLEGEVVVPVEHASYSEAEAAKGPLPEPTPPPRPAPPPEALVERFDGVVPLFNGNCFVLEGGLWRLVTPEGALLAGDFVEVGYPDEERVAVAGVEGAWGVIDWAGRTVVPPRYHRVHQFSEGRGIFAVPDAEANALLERMGLPPSNFKFGYLDLEGEEVIPAQYPLARDFEHGLAWAESPETQQGGYIDRDGVEFFE